MSAATVDIESAQHGGFSFENHLRNAAILDRAATTKVGDKSASATGTTAPSTSSESQIKQVAKKTGTTICGAVFSGGVVLGADTRSTNGEEVAEKNCEKIHYMGEFEKEGNMIFILFGIDRTLVLSKITSADPSYISVCCPFSWLPFQLRTSTAAGRGLQVRGALVSPMCFLRSGIGRFRVRGAAKM